MTREIAKAIKNVSDKINDISQRIDNHFDVRCKENASKIDDTDNAALELGEAVSDLSEAIMEIAEILSAESEAE